MEQKRQLTTEEKIELLKIQDQINSWSMSDILDPKRKDGETFEDYKFRRQYANYWLKNRSKNKDYPGWYRDTHSTPEPLIDQPLLSSFLKDNEGI